MLIVSIILKYPLQKMKFPNGGQLWFLGMYIQYKNAFCRLVWKMRFLSYLLLLYTSDLVLQWLADIDGKQKLAFCCWSIHILRLYFLHSVNLILSLIYFVP